MVADTPLESPPGLLHWLLSETLFSMFLCILCCLITIRFYSQLKVNEAIRHVGNQRPSGKRPAAGWGRLVSLRESSLKGLNCKQLFFLIQVSYLHCNQRLFLLLNLLLGEYFQIVRFLIKHSLLLSLSLLLLSLLS